MQTCLLDPEAETDFSPANQRLLALVAAGRQMWTLKVHASVLRQGYRHAACKSLLWGWTRGVKDDDARSQSNHCARSLECETWIVRDTARSMILLLTPHSRPPYQDHQQHDGLMSACIMQSSRRWSWRFSCAVQIRANPSLVSAMNNMNYDKVGDQDRRLLDHISALDSAHGSGGSVSRRSATASGSRSERAPTSTLSNGPTSGTASQTDSVGLCRSVAHQARC